jgi:hypothetical protein
MEMAKSYIDDEDTAKAKKELGKIEALVAFKVYLKDKVQQLKEIEYDIKSLSDSLDDGQTQLDFTDPDNPKIVTSGGESIPFDEDDEGDDEVEVDIIEFYQNKIEETPSNDPIAIKKLKDEIFADAELTPEEIKDLVGQLED